MDERCMWLLLGLLLSGCGGNDAASDAPKARGELTYQRYCFSCHASGVSGAPPAFNGDAWASRIAQGAEVLLQHTIDGIPSGGMPPRGMCMECTDQELSDAIDYMVTPKT